VITDILEQCTMPVGRRQPVLSLGIEVMASVGELDTLDGTVLQRSMDDL